MQQDNLNEQMSLVPQKAPDINKGDFLEYRLKRLLFYMGHYVQTNIILKTAAEEPCEVITDLDVLGISFSSDFSSQTTWADCKSGKADVLKHISWINGIKANNEIDNVIFIKKGVRKSSRDYAQGLGIKVFDLTMLEELEKKFEIVSTDWSGNFDYNFLKCQIATFCKIAIPDNRHYKNIFLFYSSTYWSLEPYAQIKKCLSGLKQLLGYYQMPLTASEKLSIKWMISEFISLFLLATYKICSKTFYYSELDKKESITNGLMSSSIPLAKQKEIRNVSVKMATEMIRQSVPDFDATILKHMSEITPPLYTEAFYNLIQRISSSPIVWKDFLRLYEYYVIEVELKGNSIEGQHKNFFNNLELKVCMKTIVYFMMDAVGFPKELFSTVFEEAVSNN